MKIILISGFLGSGKTTLAVELARTLRADGIRSALVINEVGEVGVDADLFTGPERSQLFELFSGCVCCQVSSDLVQTLKTLDGDATVDWVIIEPSGVAYTSQILDTIGYWDEEAEVVRVAIVDGPRLGSLLEHLENLVVDALSSADLIVISKSDLLDDEALSAVRGQLTELAPGPAQVAGDLLGDPEQVAKEVNERFVAT
jgi:G3E family GTPase